MLFVAGLAGIVHETLFSKVDRPSLLALFASMVGLPVALGRDRRRR